MLVTAVEPGKLSLMSKCIVVRQNLHIFVSPDDDALCFPIIFNLVKVQTPYMELSSSAVLFSRAIRELISGSAGLDLNSTSFIQTALRMSH